MMIDVESSDDLFHFGYHRVQSENNVKTSWKQRGNNVETTWKQRENKVETIDGQSEIIFTLAYMCVYYISRIFPSR